MPARRRPRVRPTKLAAIRLWVYLRAGFRCQHCGYQFQVPRRYLGRTALTSPDAHRDGRRWIRVLELDHIHPHSAGGKFEVDNLQALCTVCNTRKGAQVG